MDILNPKYFYKYLITNEDFSNDFSLYAKKNSYNNIDLEVFDSYGTHFNQQELVYDENAFTWIEKKLTKGIFDYQTTQIDSNSNFPRYIEIFKLEILGLQEQEKDLKNLMNDFATGLSGLFQKGITISSNNYDFFFYLGDDSGTATWTAVEDINGTEMIKGTLMILVEITQSVVNSNFIRLFETNFNQEIFYSSLKFSVKNDNTRDTATSSYNYKYTNERAVSNISLSGKYLNNLFCNSLFNYSINPSDTIYSIRILNESLENTFIIVAIPEGNPVENGYYELVDNEYILSEDITVNPEKDYFLHTEGYENIYKMIIFSLDFDFAFGAPVDFSLTLIPSFEVE